MLVGTARGAMKLWTKDRCIPFVQPCELVFFLVIPSGSLFEVVLVSQAATKGGPSGHSFGDVFPFVILQSKLDVQVVLFLGPFLGLLLRLFGESGG